jgi:transposase InsO family protein
LSGIHGKTPRSSDVAKHEQEPSNPYDNTTCESFLKTLKREEIYAGDYRDLSDLNRAEEFIERCYNPRRLHSALGYRSPGEFEQEKAEARSDVASAAAMMTFLGR